MVYCSPHILGRLGSIPSPVYSKPQGFLLIAHLTLKSTFISFWLIQSFAKHFLKGLLNDQSKRGFPVGKN